MGTFGTNGVIGRKEDLRIRLGMFRLTKGWSREQASKEWSKIKRNRVDQIIDYIKQAKAQ